MSLKEFTIINNKEIFNESQAKSKDIILESKIDYISKKIRIKYGVTDVNNISDNQFSKIKNTQEFEKDFYELERLELNRFLLRDSTLHRKLNSKDNNNVIKHYSPMPISACLFTGIALIIIGFSFWYFKTQRYYDIEIKNKSKERF